MRLLVVSQYFWPETFIINDLVSTLRDQGHTVVVATGKPNYPEGAVFPGYEARGAHRETYDSSIEVLRVPMRPRGASRGTDLLRNYLSFAWSGCRRFPGMLADFAPDAILVFAPSPITAALPAIRLKWRTGAHLAIWVQDLWPESLRATGHITHPALLRLVGVMVRGIYAAADTLLVQSRAFAGAAARYAPPQKIVYYPNSIRIANESAGAIPAELRDVLTRHFCVVFAGNLGSVQSVPAMVEAAALLRQEADIRLVLVGGGSMSAWVREQQAQRGLGNLLTFGRLPMSAMPAVYREAGTLLVSLKDDEILSRTVPSKLQAYLAAGRPIIGALAGEGAQLIAEAGAGLTCAPGDASALAEAIRKMYRTLPAERSQMGAAGRAYFMEHFEMGRQSERLVEILQGRIAAGRRES